MSTVCPAPAATCSPGPLTLRVLVCVVAVAGVLHVVAAVGPYQVGLVVAAIDGAAATRPQALVFGLILLVLAHGLAGGRRLARHVAVAGLMLASIASVHGGALRAAVLGCLAVALVAPRSRFPVRPDPRRLRLAGQLGVGVLALVAVGGWAGTARDRPRAIGQTILAGFNAADPPHIAHGDLLALLVGAAGVAVLALVFAPPPPPGPGTAAQRARVAALAGREHADSLAPFATRRDKAYVFSPDGRAVVGYRVLFGTAVAGGDPVGEQDSAGAALDAFLSLCRRRGWRPAVLAASAPILPSWRRRGMRGVTIGDEAVLDVASFSLRGRRMRNVRQAVRRTYNAGVTVTVGALTDELGRELRPVLDDWLDGRAERGFAMNLDRILAPRADCLVVAGYDSGGCPVAFARFGVCAGGRILTLDVAPRRRDAPNGVVERLVVEAVEYGRVHGATEVSLSFVGLRRLLEVGGRLGRAAAVAVRVFDPWIELRPLYRFCAKFQPGWRPRSLLLRSWLSLGPVGLAALAAEFGTRAGADLPRGAEPDAVARQGERVSRRKATPAGG